jgi:hypothetical protein
MHTAERVAPESVYFPLEIPSEGLKIYKSTGIDQIPAQLFQAGGNTIYSVIHKYIKYIWNKD